MTQRCPAAAAQWPVTFSLSTPLPHSLYRIWAATPAQLVISVHAFLTWKPQKTRLLPPFRRSIFSSATTLLSLLLTICHCRAIYISVVPVSVRQPAYYDGQPHFQPDLPCSLLPSLYMSQLGGRCHRKTAFHWLSGEASRHQAFSSSQNPDVRRLRQPRRAARLLPVCLILKRYQSPARKLIYCPGTRLASLNLAISY